MKITTTVSIHYRNYPDPEATAYARERAIKAQKLGLLGQLGTIAGFLALVFFFLIFDGVNFREPAALLEEASISGVLQQVAQGAGLWAAASLVLYWKIAVYPIDTHRVCCDICYGSGWKECAPMYLWRLVGFLGMCFGASLARSGVFWCVAAFKAGAIALGIGLTVGAVAVLAATVVLLAIAHLRASVY